MNLIKRIQYKLHQYSIERWFAIMVMIGCVVVLMVALSGCGGPIKTKDLPDAPEDRACYCKAPDKDQWWWCCPIKPKPHDQPVFQVEVVDATR